MRNLFGATFPNFIMRMVDDEIELTDRTQQVHLILFNQSQTTIKVRIWADEKEKKSFTLAPFQKNGGKGMDNSCEIFSLIFVCIPEFSVMRNDPQVVFCEGTSKVNIKILFTTEAGGELGGNFKVGFVSEQNSIPWDQSMSS